VELQLRLTSLLLRVNFLINHKRDACASVGSLGVSDTFEIVSVTATELKLRVTHTQSGITITVNESFTKG